MTYSSARPLALSIAWVLTAAVATAAHPKASPFKDTVTLANELYENGELDAAEFQYRKLLFARPGYGKARQRLGAIRKQQATELVEAAGKFGEHESWTKAKLLRQAYRLNRKNREAKKGLEELGYELRGGEWYSPEELERLAGGKTSGHEKRRQQLGLNDGFEVIITGPVRLFTNVNVRDARSVIAQMTNSNVTLHAKYREVMGAFDLNDAKAYLDIVLFDTREEYMRRRGVSGSAGVYIPSFGAGFFFRDGSINFSTMLHEMTHQNNDKLLQGRPNAWFEEGIAEYFGSAFVTQGGKRMKVGVSDSHRLQSFKEAVKDAGGYYIPLEQFLSMPQAELTNDFYSQAWAVTFYLMEVHPHGRLILFDYVAGVSRLGHRLRSVLGAPRALRTIIEGHGETLAEFEKGMLRYYREGK